VILLKRAFYILKDQNHPYLEIECPKDIMRSKFEETFESFFKTLFGFPPSIFHNNIDILSSISPQIENSVLLNSVVEFLQSNDISNNETILMILRCSEFISEQFDIDSIVSKIAEDFKSLSFGSL
jgi:hypothetical protein